MKRKPWGTGLCIGLLAALGACVDSSTGNDENVACDGVTDGVQFWLTFTGDVSFQGPHAGDRATITTSCTSGDGFLGSGGGSSGPIFGPSQTISFGTGGGIESGAEYQIYIWIDSNIGGGTEGVCDPPAIDHQWIVTIPTVTGDVNIIFSHDDATVTDVCSAFDGLELFPSDL